MSFSRFFTVLEAENVSHLLQAHYFSTIKEISVILCNSPGRQPSQYPIHPTTCTVRNQVDKLPMESDLHIVHHLCSLLLIIDRGEVIETLEEEIINEAGG